MSHPASTRPVLLPTALPWARQADPTLDGALCCEHGVPPPPELRPGARARLAELDAHLYCSVIGTCLSTGELRKLMTRFFDTVGASDLAVHHEAVRLLPHDAELAKLLHKALERRHEAAVQRYARERDDAGLLALWEESLRSGEVPGAYWAVLTHRRTTPELRQRVFGDVHMLSHLVGAANRADIRRLVALERDNDELRERLERAQERNAELAAERDQAVAERADALATAQAARGELAQARRSDAGLPGQERLAALSSALALQAQRREAAEALAEAARQDAARLAQELERLRGHAAELAAELGAAEAQLQAELHADGAAEGGIVAPLHAALRSRRVLYVGGRPSSTPAIRAAVLRAGGEFRHHDGGIEDRKGLLAPALAWAELVAFPVDCIDHDSALALKRDCVRQGRPFAALRSASLASFVAALCAHDEAAPPARSGLCMRHG